jgi:N-acetylglucosamine transport system permease protein
MKNLNFRRWKENMFKSKSNKNVEKKSLKKEIKMLPGYILLILWCVFTFVLVGWVFLASLSTTRGIFTNKLFDTGIHFENYVKAFTNNNVGTYFINSIIYTTTSCIGIIAISAPCAYVIARFAFKGKKALQTSFVSALSVPQIMLILPLFSLVAQLGLTNSRIVLIILYICINVPFTIFFLTSFFTNIPFAFEEAAAIDGCGPIKTFWLIMLPLAQPGIITVTIFNFITVWNEFFMALIFVSDSKLRPLALGLYTMVQSMRYTGDWAGMFAAVIIVFLPTLFIYIFLSEKIIAGVTGGGVKG